jgi:hypothetical protein
VDITMPGTPQPKAPIANVLMSVVVGIAAAALGQAIGGWL